MNRLMRITFVLTIFIFVFVNQLFADASAGVNALEQVTSDIKLYIAPVQKVCYALAGVVSIIGAVTVFFKMNNEDQDVKKAILLIVGACIFLLSAAKALPLFFN